MTKAFRCWTVGKARSAYLDRQVSDLLMNDTMKACIHLIDSLVVERTSLRSISLSSGIHRVMLSMLAKEF